MEHLLLSHPSSIHEWGIWLFTDYMAKASQFQVIAATYFSQCLFFSDPSCWNRREKQSGFVSEISTDFFLFSGAEISCALVQLLQKKLDEAVLDVITVMLARNPMCKLTPEDIQVNCSQETDNFHPLQIGRKHYMSFAVCTSWRPIQKFTDLILWKDQITWHMGVSLRRSSLGVVSFSFLSHRD